MIGSSSVQARFQSCAIVVVMALLLSLGIGAPATAAVPVTDTPLRGVQGHVDRAARVEHESGAVSQFDATLLTDGGAIVGQP